MEKIKKFFQDNDLFAKHCGIELIELSEGRAVTRMEINDYHMNGVNVIHGGAIFTLADFAFAAACNSYGQIAVAINVDISFVKAGLGKYLTAEVRELSRGKKISNYFIEVKDDQGELVSVFKGVSYIRNMPLPLD